MTGPVLGLPSPTPKKVSHSKPKKKAGGGLIAVAVAKQVKVALKAQRNQTKSLVKTLVVKEVKKALRSLLK